MMTPGKDAWARLMRLQPGLAAEPLVACWAERGFPLVLRRRLPGDPADELPLGLPLPPSHGKKRLALTLPAQDILRTAPPPRLAEVASQAPAAWRGTIASLLELCPHTRCFGSLAWQHLTGLTYLSPSSDLDLLWDLPNDPAGLLSGIELITRNAPMRIDGEVSGQSGAVQWHELLTATDRVAVKSETGVTLMQRDAFLLGRHP